jgi:hypothetical protein
MKMMEKSPLVPLKRGKDRISAAIVVYSNHPLPFKGEVEKDFGADGANPLPNIRGTI